MKETKVKIKLKQWEERGQMCVHKLKPRGPSKEEKKKEREERKTKKTKEEMEAGHNV